MLPKKFQFKSVKPNFNFGKYAKPKMPHPRTLSPEDKQNRQSLSNFSMATVDITKRIRKRSPKKNSVPSSSPQPQLFLGHRVYRDSELGFEPQLACMTKPQRMDNDVDTDEEQIEVGKQKLLSFLRDACLERMKKTIKPKCPCSENLIIDMRYAIIVQGVQYRTIYKMEDLKAQTYLVKIIVIGDSGVGKTNLITRFCENHFKQTYTATIGVDFKIKTIPIGDKKFKMQIWDTAGQERFKNITQTYYKGAAGILLVYSLADAQSFANIERWMAQIDTNAPEDVSRVLVATKNDLEGERCVSVQQGQELAAKYGIPFMEVSAKTGNMVKEVFQALGEEIVRRQHEKGEVVGFGRTEKVVRMNTLGDRKKDCAC